MAMPLALRWLVLIGLVVGLPYVLIIQFPHGPGQHQLFGMIALAVSVTFLILTTLVAFALPSIYTRYYEAKKLAGSHYQNHLRAFQQSATLLGLGESQLLIINDGAPHAFGVGMVRGKGLIIMTRGLLDALDPDQLQAYLDVPLMQMAKGHTAAMTFGAAAAFILLLPLKIADLVDSDAVRVLLTVIFGWFGALFVQAIGLRSQFYEIDQLAARHHGSTGALALGSALNDGQKTLLKHGLQRIDYSSSPLFVVNPLGSKGVAAIFATHAPTPKRVKRLQRVGTKVVGKEAVAKSKGLV